MTSLLACIEGHCSGCRRFSLPLCRPIWEGERFFPTATPCLHRSAPMSLFVPIVMVPGRNLYCRNSAMLLIAIWVTEEMALVRMHIFEPYSLNSRNLISTIMNEEWLSWTHGIRNSMLQGGISDYRPATWPLSILTWAALAGGSSR